MTKELYKTISGFDRFIITIVVMSATLMQVIDTTIVNVALPHMQGSLSASSDEITWTLTSYLISSAIFMPLTGYFTNRFGRKKFLIISIAGFTLFSAFCGAATSLGEIVSFRLLQGVFGAGLVPLSQAILTDIFPPEERGKAMAIWGIGVMVGPIIGPTLGGYLTDVSTWRWTFYVNIPVGIFTLLLTNIIPDSPPHKRHMDWLGLLLISIAVGGTQFVLDRGNQEDWFNSNLIIAITYITITALLGFILHISKSPNHLNKKNSPAVFDVQIFKDKNFMIASLILAIFGLGLYGTMVIQPIMMEGLLNYPALTAGLMLAPRGISGMVSMILVGKLITRWDPRALIISGVLLSVAGMWINTYFSLYISPSWIIIPMILQGLGFGIMFVPLSTLAFSTLPGHLRTEAAGLFSLVRTIGGSTGISIAITLLTRRTQLFWNELGASIEPYNANLYQYLSPLHLTQQQNIALLANELHRQAMMVAFVNVIAFIMYCFLLMIPLTFLFTNAKTTLKTSMDVVAD